MEGAAPLVGLFPRLRCGLIQARDQLVDGPDLLLGPRDNEAVGAGVGDEARAGLSEELPQLVVQFHGVGVFQGDDLERGFGGGGGFRPGGSVRGSVRPPLRRLAGATLGARPRRTETAPAKTAEAAGAGGTGEAP